MTQRTHSHPVSGLSILSLIGLFALLCLLTVVLSLQAFEGITADVTQQGNRRLAASYLQNRIRSCDAQNAISVTEKEGIPCLQLRQGDLYSLIYVQDGQLMEQLWDETDAFDPTLGEAIAPAQSLEATLSSGLLILSLTDGQGEPLSLTLPLRTTQEVQP